MLDTNVWRYLVDEGPDISAVLALKRTAGECRVKITACPAVVYEALRTNDVARREDLVRATTLGTWSRLMPEAYFEAAEVYRLLAAHRPEWLTRRGDLDFWYKLQADWSGGYWWRRARKEPALEASRIASISSDTLDSARTEAKNLRRWAREAGLKTESFDLADVTSGFGERAPWGAGKLVDPWRAKGCAYWWGVLNSEPSSTPRDWVEPWINRQRIVRAPDSWARLWLVDASAASVPMQWLRSALELSQMTRKTTPGTPVDNQIGSYLPLVDHFATADRGFLAAIESVRGSSPVPLAHGHLIAANRPVVGQLADLMSGLKPAI